MKYKFTENTVYAFCAKNRRFIKSIKWKISQIYTNVIKYIQDRSLYFGNNQDQTDVLDVKNRSTQFPFESTTFQIAFSGGTGSVETTFSSGITTDINNNNVALGVSFTSGLASPEINKGSGEIIYLDNRPLVTRNSRQKEDIKIILEF